MVNRFLQIQNGGGFCQTRGLAFVHHGLKCDTLFVFQPACGQRTFPARELGWRSGVYGIYWFCHLQFFLPTVPVWTRGASPKSVNLTSRLNPSGLWP